MGWLNRYRTSQRQASQYARSLLEASLDPLVTISPEGKITDVNAATVKITGVSREGLIGTDFSDYFTEPEKARQGYREVFEKGFVTNYPLTIRHVDGQLTHVLYNASVYRDVSGQVLGVFAAARDITAQRQASQYARSLLEASLDPLVTISPEGKITDVNEATIKVTGVSREELIGTDFSNYFTEPEQARQGYREAFEKGFVTDYPLTIRHITGRLTHVLYNASVYRDVNGRVLGVFAAARDVTAQHQASLYARSLIEASLDPLVTISTDGTITDVNEATVKVTGVSREGLIGTDFSNYFTEPDKARQGYREAFEKGFVTDYPLTIAHRDGRRTDVLYNASVYRDPQGTVRGVFAAARDVTASKRAMREFVETKNFLDNILQSSIKYSIIAKDLDRRIVSWNEGARRNYGYTEEEVIGKSSSMLHAPEEIASGKVDRMMATVDEKGIAEGEFQRIRKDGSRFVASVVITRRSDPSGRPVGYLLISSDVTEKKQAEQQLHYASAYTRSLIEASLDPLVTISAEGKITDVNRATEQATGFSRERLIGSDFADYFTEPEEARKGYRRVLDEGLVRDYPLALRHTSGRVMDVLYNASIYKNPAGEVQGVFAAARDVTERKRAEEEIVRLSRSNKLVLDSLGQGLYGVDREGRCTFINPAAVRMLGYATADEILGKPSHELFHHSLADGTPFAKAECPVHKVSWRGEVFRGADQVFWRKDGTSFPVEFVSTPIMEEGKVTGAVVGFFDISERKALEAKVKERSERLETVLQESQDAVNVLSASASEILSAISQLAAGATEAASAVSETTTTVEEVRQTARLSNEKAREIAGAGNNAARVLQSGQANVEAAVAEMNRIRDQMGAIAETIVRLSEQSQAIGEITGTVNELAEQSHLLAVNAAIEAAKAGEQGKGFAVVAQEIRSLAEQSKQATTQVRALLSDVQKAIGGAVMTTEQTGKVVDSGVAQSQQAGESIRIAVEATVEVARTSSQIVATSQQQQTGVDQVAIAMENINQASTQNAQSTKQVETVAQNLHDLSQKLKQLITQSQGAAEQTHGLERQ